MAFLPLSQIEKDKLKDQEGQTGPQLASGPSGVITGGPSQSTPQAPGHGPSKSGSFTNLNAYLSANKEQADQLGQRVAGTVAGQAEQAKTQLGQVQNQFQTQADQGSVRRDQNLVNSAVSDPTKFVQDKNNVQKFSAIRDAVYKGPQGIQDVQGYGEAQKSVQNAQQAVDNTKSEAGRFTLVQDQFKKPSYSTGQQKLDQLLLQNSQGSRQAFGNLQNQYSNLSNLVGSATKQAQDYAAGRKAETEAARQDVATALGRMDDPSTPENEAAGAFGNFQDSLNKKRLAEEARQSQIWNDANRYLAGTAAVGTPNAPITPEIAKLLGLNSGDKLYDVNLKQFQAQFDPSKLNVQNVASADDYARYAALSQLAGTDQTYLYDPSLAGTGNALSFDQSQLRGALDNAQARYNQVMGGDLARIRDIASGVNQIRESNRRENEQGRAKDGITEVPEWAQTEIQSLGPNASRADVANYLSSTQKEFEDLRQALGAQRIDNRVGQGGQFQAIQDWLKSYDALNPDRTAKVR